MIDLIIVTPYECHRISHWMYSFQMWYIIKLCITELLCAGFTVTTNHCHNNPLKQKYHHGDIFSLVAPKIVFFANFWCSQYQKCRQHDEISVFVKGYLPWHFFLMLVITPPVFLDQVGCGSLKSLFVPGKPSATKRLLPRSQGQCNVRIWAYNYQNLVNLFWLCLVFLWSSQVTCRDMCKIVTWYDDDFLMENQQKYL